MLGTWFQAVFKPAACRAGLLCPGSLFQLDSGNLADKFFFLAYAMKKPQTHVLMQGFQKHRTLPGGRDTMFVSILNPDSGMPVFWTSHQLFQRVLLGKEHDSQEGIRFWIHKYSMGSFASLCDVQTSQKGQAHHFSLQVKAQVQTKLPFGIKPCARKRKPNNQPVPSQKKRRGPSRPSGASGSGDNGLGPGEFVSAGAKHDVQIQMGLHLAVGSGSSDSDSSSSDDSDSDPSTGNSEKEVDTDSERPFLTPSANQEAEAINKVFESHRDLVEARGGLFLPHGHGDSVSTEWDPVVPGGGLAGGPSSSSTPAPNSSVGSAQRSFCNRELGLVELGVQTAAKLAQCRHCLQKIPRHSVRFGYAWSYTKWHSWLHHHCLIPHILQERGDKTQAATFLKAKIHGEKQLSEDVVNAAKQALQDLAEQDV